MLFASGLFKYAQHCDKFRKYQTSPFKNKMKHLVCFDFCLEGGGCTLRGITHWTSKVQRKSYGNRPAICSSLLNTGYNTLHVKWNGNCTISVPISVQIHPRYILSDGNRPAKVHSDIFSPKSSIFLIIEAIFFCFCYLPKLFKIKLC